MGLSLVERKLVESIKKDLSMGKTNFLKIGVLSEEGAAALVQEKNFTFKLRNLNNKAAAGLIRMIQENTIMESLDERDKFELCTYIFNGRNLDFVRKQLRECPLIVTYYLFSKNQLFEEAINSFSVPEQKIIFDSYYALSEKNCLPFSFYDIYKYMVNLEDEDKINYMRNTIYSMSFQDMDGLFASFKSHERLIEAVDIFYDKSNVNDFVNVLNYVSSDELVEIIKPKLVKNSFGKEVVAKNFSFEQQIEILNYLIQNNSYNVGSFANLIINYYMEKNSDLGVFDRLNQIYIQNGLAVSAFNLDLVKKKINEMSGEELLNLYLTSSFEPFKKYIESEKELWQKEPVLSHMINNDIAFVCEYVFKANELTDKERTLFLNKEIVRKMFTNLETSREFESVAYRYQNTISEYVKDEDFARKLFKNNPRLIETFFTEEMDPSLIRFAFDNGYIPYVQIYNKFKDRPDIIDVWISCVKDFDPNNKEFSLLFNNLINTVDIPMIQEILLSKAADTLNMSYENFLVRFDALKKVNSEILSTLDYRLFDEKYSFLSANKIEMLGANKSVSSKLCELSENQLKVVKQIMNYSSSVNWVDLLDRILNNIYYYSKLIDDLADKDLSIDEISLLAKIMIHSNFLKINSYDDLIHYDELLNGLLTNLETSDDILKYRELISLSVLGISYNEFLRIYTVYCNDLSEFCKISKNEDVKRILILIKNVSECNSLETLKEIYNSTPRLKVSTELIINLDSEIRREFLKMYNDSLYKAKDEDKMDTKKFTLKSDETGKMVYVLDDEGVEVNFYSPIGLGDEQKEFSLIMTSLGAYSDHSEPDDYYASWNIDLIQSHGFCCSYLKNDNLGTARICHACLGFSDFDPDALLLSAPYDIGSAAANTKFNTSREIDTRFYTPRGMCDATRHTHNEMVFERRNLKGGESFKKEPTYAVFFCNDFNNLTNEEKRIYDSTIKAAIQLGKDGKALPVVVVERMKIAKYQYDQINNKIVKLLENYEPGLAKSIMVLFINNRVGNAYSEGINNKYFNRDFQKSIIDVLISRIIDLKKQGRTQEALLLYNEIDNTIKEEQNKTNSGLATIFKDEFDKFKNKMDIINLASDKDSQLLRTMYTAIAELDDDKCLNRWNSLNSDLTENYFMATKDAFNLLFNSVDKASLARKVAELEEDNIYEANTPYNNRYIANKFLFTLLMIKDKELPSFSNDLLLDVIKYQRCSYMDGSSQKNVLSSINKAEMIMAKRNYSQKDIDKIKLLIFLQDKKNIDEAMVKEIVRTNHLETIISFDVNELQKAINIIHDAECLEHTRFVTAGEIDKSYFYDDSNFYLTRFAYQLEESYALMDIRDHLKNNPEANINLSVLNGKNNPQEIIRSIRKGRNIESKHENNTYENAFLELDVLEKTDPLNLMQQKLDNYDDLPEQIPLSSLYEQITNMSNYSYLNQKIENREDLYLNCSEIHGATHANNVSLFATYIACSMGFSDTDIKTIIEAAIYHDIGRTNDNHGNNHGEYGAVKYGAYVECPEDMKVNEVEFLIEAHALPSLNLLNQLYAKYKIDDENKERLYKMATVIRDADALDRTRFRLLEPSNNLKIECLVNDISKKMIESCQRLNYIIYQDYVEEKMKSESASFTK